MWLGGGEGGSLAGRQSVVRCGGSWTGMGMYSVTCQYEARRARHGAHGKGA